MGWEEATMLNDDHDSNKSNTLREGEKGLSDAA